VFFYKISLVCLVAVKFPKSLYLLKKYNMNNKPSFDKYVVCMKCHSIFDIQIVSKDQELVSSQKCILLRNFLIMLIID